MTNEDLENRIMDRIRYETAPMRDINAALKEAKITVSATTLATRVYDLKKRGLVEIHNRRWSLTAAGRESVDDRWGVGTW